MKYVLQDLDEAEDGREMEDFDNDMEGSLSRSASQQTTTRDGATHPDDESTHVIYFSFYSKDCQLFVYQQ